MARINKLAPWKVVDEHNEVDNLFLRVRNITFELPNGKLMPDYFVAEKTPVSIIIPIKDKKTYLIKEWERGVNVVGHKFPAGRVKKDETPELGAIRELLEELGLEADRLVSLGKTFVEPGFMNTYAHYFLCTDFVDHSDQMTEDPFELFEGEWVDFKKIESMIYRNEIKNPFVIVGYFLAKKKLEDMNLI